MKIGNCHLCCELQLRVRFTWFWAQTFLERKSRSYITPVRYLAISIEVNIRGNHFLGVLKVIFCIISQDLLTRKFDSHSKLGIAYHVYDITGADIVKR